MKILLLTVGTINYNCDINFFESMKSMGYDVIRYNYYEKFNEIGKAKMNKEIIALAESICPDYIFFITYQEQISNNTLEKLTRRPTCFVTGISMVYFIFAYLIGLATWVVSNWRKIK